VQMRYGLFFACLSVTAFILSSTVEAETTVSPSDSQVQHKINPNVGPGVGVVARETYLSTRSLVRRARPTTGAAEMLRRTMTTRTLSRQPLTTEALARLREERANQRLAGGAETKPLMSEAELRAWIAPTTASLSAEKFITLVHSSNRRSTVETCHCPAHPTGGIDREARVVQELESLYGQRPLIVDAGGFLRLPPNERSKLGARIVLEALAKMKVDAVNVGITDLAAGTQFLRDMATSTSVTLLSANIFDKHGKPVFTPSRIVSLTLKDGKTAKIALIGVTRPLDATRREFTPANDATVTTPAKTLKKLIPELRKKADLVVLLAYYTREDVPELVKELPPDARPDLVVCGEFTAGQRQSYYLENAHTTDGVWSLSGGFEGRQVGVALIELGKKGKVQNVYPKLVIIEQTIPPDEAFTPFVKEFQAGQLELLRKGI